MRALIMFLLLGSLLLCLARSAGVSPILLRNPYMSTGKAAAVVWSNIGPTSYYSFTGQNYISVFPHTISTIKNVYYTTQSIEYRLVTMQQDILNPYLQYYLFLQANSNSYIDTRIYSYQNYFVSFTYNYILIYDNNPFINTHLTIDQIYVYSGQTFSNLPSMTTTLSILTYKYFRSHGYIQYSSNKLINSDNFEFFMTVRGDIFIANQTIKTTLNLPSSISGNGYYGIYFLLIVVDQTALQRDYPAFRYILQSYNTSGGLTISSDALRDLLSDRNSNYVFGLSKYFYYNNVQPSYQYQCVRNTNLNTITAAFLGSTFRIKPMRYFSQPFMQYGFAAFPLYSCSDPVYNYNSTSHLCQSAIDCIKGYFYNASSQVCELCRRNCIDCTESLCLQCGLKRKIVDNACAVEKGYYETNISTVESRDASCLSCQESPTKCSSCAQDYFLRDQACITCPQLITNCRACSLSTCLACDHGYFLINSTFCGLPCIDFECLVCDHADRTYCHKCRKASYLLVDGICEPDKQKPVIFGCGDSIINIGQECDDGKNINRDGCSSYCTVEDDYSCETYIDNFANNRTNYCAYLHEIDFEPVSVEKLDFSNSIRITVAVKQYREVFWDTQITLNINVVQQPIPYRNMKVSFVKRSSQANGNSKAAVQSVNDPFPQSSLLYITFDYFKSMHGQDVNLSFYFGESLDLRVKQIPKKTVTLTILPDNNHYAHLYPAEIYSYQRQLNSFFSFLVIASLTLFILTLIFGSKRISVEMIVVLQIAFLSLVTIPKITPLFSSLSSLSHSGSGFNLLYSEDVRPFHDSDTNDRIKGTRLYSQFIYNVNLSLAFVFLPLLIGFVTLFVGKVINFSRKHADNVESAYKRLLAEYPFAGLVFVGCSVGAASVLQIHFGLQNASTLGLAVMALSLFMFILYGVLRCKCSQHFGEFNEMLIEDSSFALLFQTVYFYLGVSVAVLYFQFYSFVFINFAVAAFVVLLYVLTLVKPIFRKNIDKYRTQLNLLSVLLLQIPGMYMNMRINAGFLYKSKEDMSLLLPLLTMSVISLNFMLNSIYIFYEWYKSLKKCFITAIKQSDVKQILMNQDKLYLSNQYKQLIKNSLSKPLNLQQMKCVDHKKRRFRQNFIQDQDQQSTTFKQMLNQRKELQNFVLAGIKRSLRKDTQIREDNTLQVDRSNKIKVI